MLRRSRRAAEPSTLLVLMAVAILGASTAVGSGPRGPGPTLPESGLAPLPAPRLPALSVGPLSSGESTLAVVPNDPSDVPNSGLEMNLTGFGPTSLGPYASFQVAAEETIGSYDAVFGLFQNSTFGPTGFFEVFTSVGDQTVHLAYGAPLATAPGVGYRFELTASTSSLWTLTVNGVPFGGNASDSSFDFGASQATVARGLEFSEVAFYANSASDVVPPTVVATTALALRVAGAWYLPHNATTSFTGDATGRWGAQGRDQAPELAPGEVRSGTSVAAVPNGTALWSGGPVPVALAFTLSGATTTATLPVLINATVRNITGATIPGVPLSVHDSLGGTELEGGNSTGPLGSAELELITPNVSATGTDLVTVSTTILGYLGSSSRSLVLTPAIQIALIASPAEPTVPVNGSVTLIIRAAVSGGAAPYTTLEFSSGLGGALSISYGECGADGSIAIRFYAGAVPATVLLHAVVVEPGAWGGLTIPVHIVRPAVPFWVHAEPWIAVGLTVGLVATVAMVLRGRRRRPLPDLPLGNVPLADAGPPEAERARLSRRPPSEGSP